MEMAARAAGDHHVGGLYTQMLMKPLQEELPAATIKTILEGAGESRSMEELCDPSCWSSYGQFKSLLRSAKQSLESLRPGTAGLRSVIIQNTELVETAQAFGSPASLFTSGSSENPLLPIRLYETTEIGPNEWTIRERFMDGFEPFPEFCEFAGGLLAVIPMIFGLPAGDVVEDECQCRGDAACLFRLRWESHDQASQIEFLRVRAHLLESRLRQLHDMVEDLATNERYEDVLESIVGSSFRAAGAGIALLALEARPNAPRKSFAKGLSEAEAASLADELLEGRCQRPEVFAVPVASARNHYGVLAVDGKGGVFASHAEEALETYARLAAAALDSADAIEDARHQANTARVLLELSSSLAQIVTTEEMVSRVVQAAPALVDCDRVAVFLHDADRGETAQDELRFIGSSGYPDDLVEALRSRPLRTSEYADSFAEDGIIKLSKSEFGNVAAITAPLHSAGQVIGYIVAGVTTQPERLAITPQLADRLKGLAAQASIAISNSRLVDQIRFQAVHDGLTGLPNRSLVLDRAEQLLARTRRSQTPVAALFIDLDGFKHINDTFGHGVGDQVLKAVATRLTTTMRASDSAGRLGGDEFVMLIEGCVSGAGPEAVAERVLAALRIPFNVEGASPLRVSASIGIAVGARPTASELLRDADSALYQAKAAGKDRYVVYRSDGSATVPDHCDLVAD
jgi:diguanylate cyclase (GGDEF)-like protein